MYGVAPEDVTHEMRTSAKAINFGIIYGKGSYSLSRDLSITVQEAQSFIDAYLNTYPNVRRYMEDTVAYGKSTAMLPRCTAAAGLCRNSPRQISTSAHKANAWR